MYVPIGKVNPSPWMLLLPLVVSAAAGAGQPRAVKNLSKLPLAFEQNRGQAPPSIDYLARGQGYGVFLSRGNAHISLLRGESAGAAGIDLRLIGARPDPLKNESKPLPGKVNYFMGNDPARWRVDIPTFERIEYRGVYRGIDLAYYGNQGRLEYDFIVAPGARLNAVRMAVEGASKLSIASDGALVIETGGGRVEFRKPHAYQEAGGKRRTVESHYALDSAGRMRFEVAAYDHHRPLIIDPSLAYSTFLGGSYDDNGVAIAVGPKGNAFVTGYTSSLDFPAASPEQAFFTGYSSIFISKLSNGGSSLVYSTYLAGSSYDYAYAIAVDSSDNAYVAGETSSTDFPTKNPLYAALNGPEDGFLIKLNSAGNALVFSTYLGGSSNDYATGVALDATNSVYVSGFTASSDFPATPGAYQPSCSNCSAFVTKLNSAGSGLMWSSYFGSNFSAYVTSLAVDSRGGAYLTGYTFGNLPVTSGSPQPVFGGNEDAFVARFNSTGTALSYCTYLGGSQTDYGSSIAVDTGGNAYVAGYTNSTNLPVTASVLQATEGGGWDGFVAKLNDVGTQWQYVTYLGGHRDDYAYGIAVDASGNAYVAGQTISSNFPSVASLQAALAGNSSLLLKTTSGGSTWGRSDTGIPTTINQIAADPPSDAHLFATTAEGLYQSSDSGAHWTSTNVAGLPRFSAFDSIVIAPAGTSGSSFVYLSSGSAVYSSRDDGATWALAGDSPCYVQNLAVNPVNPKTLYVAGGSSCPAAKSTDGGATWTTLPGFPANAAVSNLAINPKTPATIYAATNFGIYGSTDGGKTWTQLFPLNASSVLVDPQQPSILYAVISGTVYISTNAGATWGPTGSGLTTCINALAIAPSNPSTLYAATCNGVYRTTVSGASWSPAGLPNDNIYTLAIDPAKQGTVYAAATVNPDGFVAKIDPTGVTLSYATYLGGSGYEHVSRVALDAGGDAFVTGQTNSADFPTSAGAFQHDAGNNGIYRDYTAFVSKISAKTGSCAYTTSPVSLFFYPNGGAANLSVVAPSGCAWTPRPSASWIMAQSHGGPGVGPLTVSVSANSGAARRGSVALGTGSLAITQAASGCFYSLSTYSLTIPQTGGPASISVTAGSGCGWVVTNPPDWLTITSGASGTGNGTVHFQAAANPFPETRSYFGSYFGSGLNVAGSYVSLNQIGTAGAGVRQPTQP